jgi:hypothetical protein
MKKFRFLSVVAVAVVAFGAAGSMRAPALARGSEAHVAANSTTALRAAAMSPAKTFTTEPAGAFATVYNADGKKFAVLDYSAKDAPKGAVEVDGVEMKTLGLDYIDVVTADSAVIGAPAVEASSTSDAKATGDSATATGTPVADRIGATSFKDWHDGWKRNGTGTSSYTERVQSDGEVPIGCQNDTNDTITADCTLATQAAWTQNGMFEITIDQVAKLGFNIGHTDTRSISWTIKTTPPHSEYVLTPMMDQLNVGWPEINRHYQCERDWTWFGCKSGTTRQIHAHDSFGTANKATRFVGRLTRQDY